MPRGMTPRQFLVKSYAFINLQDISREVGMKSRDETSERSRRD